MKSFASRLKTISGTHPQWVLAFSFILVVCIYWGVIASDRYVSEAIVVLESSEVSRPMLSVGSLFSGGGNSQDLLLLREYLLSVDMIVKLEETLAISEHYSDKRIDFFSRLEEDAYVGDLHEYVLSYISVDMNDYSGVLRVRVQAFSSEMAFKISSLLLIEGERHMNAMGKELALEQVKFLEQQVSELSDSVNNSRSKLIAYQNEYGQISPEATAMSLSGIVAVLEGELATIKAKRAALATYLSSESNELLKLDSQIVALKEQIEEQESRLADSSQDSSLNDIAAGYKAIELRMQLSLDLYSGALVALESTRADATRKLKQVSILQSPRVPEYAIEPRRLYNMISFGLAALVITAIVSLIITLVKEHND